MDGEAFDNRLKELLRRRSVNGAFHAIREGHFFDHFIVVGLNPDTNKKALSSAAIVDLKSTCIEPESPQFSIKTEDIIALSNQKSPEPKRIAPALSRMSLDQRPSDPPSSFDRRKRSSSGSSSIAPEERREMFLRDHSKKEESWVHLTEDENGNPLKPEIIYKFPPEKEIPFEVVPFCFPQQPRIKKVKRRGSFSQVHNAIFGSMRLLEKTKNTFLFMLVKDTEVFYGICVRNKELLKRWPSFAQNNQHKNNLKTLTDYASFCTRIYCFISRFPFFKLHYDIIFSVLARERLYIFEEQKGGLESLLRQSRANLLETLQEETDENTNSNQTNEILSLLDSYYGQRVPKSGQSLSFKLPGEVHSLDFTCPDGDEDKLIANWCLPVLFKAVKMENILTMVAAAMQERSIIIQCSNPGILSALVLSMIPLLRPYIWQGPIIPILPSNMFEYLQSPVPYIVGVVDLTGDGNAMIDLSDFLVVKIDKKGDVITLPLDKPIPLPHVEKLVSNLKAMMPKSYETRYHDPQQVKKEDIDTVVKFTNELQQYHQSLLDPIKLHIKPGILQIMDKNKLINSIPKKFRDFFVKLIETQQFAEFLQHISLLQFEEEQPAQVVLAQVEDKIQQLEKQKKEALEKIRDADEQITHLRKQQTLLLAGTKNTKSIGLIKSSVEYLTRSYNDKIQQTKHRRGHSMSSK